VNHDRYGRWRHEHVFDTGNAAGQRGTRAVAVGLKRFAYAAARDAGRGCASPT